MFQEVINDLKSKITHFSKDDKIIFNGKEIQIDLNNFQDINEFIGSDVNNKTIAFIDGGQAEILSAANFCLSFIRVVAVIIQNNIKIKQEKKEFFLLTTSRYFNNDIYYESKIFGDKLVDEHDLLVSSNDSTIKNGKERAAISKVTNIARRFSELALAKLISSDFVVLDGTLEPSFKNEDKYLGNYCALAKSSSLFTTCGNSPVVLLDKLKKGIWNYFVDDKTYFVKLHDKSKYVFRFEGDKGCLSILAKNSIDATFLGYPYGLILVDKLARVSNSEKNSLKMKFLLDKNNLELTNYLTTTNAHDILDNLS